MTPLRLGLLGASKIAPYAAVKPARVVDRVEVVAVAARDVGRAEEFAAAHAVPLVFDSYAALVESDEVDAVYIGLPTAAHAEWTIAAARAGKHVLCEKPFACTAAEAEAMVQAGAESDRVVCEAFHWRYHPLAARIRAVLDSGRIGAVKSVEAVFSVAVPDETDIRHQLRLGGGAFMDLGCYTVQLARLVAGRDPEVLSARATEGLPGIDVAMDVELRFGDELRATLRCSMEPDAPTKVWLRVDGDDGVLEVDNPLLPQLGHELRVTDPSGTSTEQVEGQATYVHQLEAFVAAVLDGASLLTGGDDAIATARVLERCYALAGLPTRGA